MKKRSMAVGVSIALAAILSTGTAVAAAPHDNDGLAHLGLSATQAPTGGVVTAYIGTEYPSSDPLVGSIDFGDGSAPVSTLTSATHSYAAIGTYTVTATVTDGTDAPQSTTQTINVVAPSPLNVQFTATALYATTVSIDPTATTDSWNIDSGTVSFGDRTSAPLVFNDGLVPSVQHRYAKPGTYAIVVYLSDADRNTATNYTEFSTNGSAFTPLDPTRILDTRSGLGAPAARVQPGPAVRLKVAGNGAIPAGVSAVALNLTVTDASGRGFVTAYADGSAVPNVSNVNYTAGRTATDSAIVPVGPDGYIDLADQGGPAGPVDLLADVPENFDHGNGNDYDAVAPARILDTRSGLGASAGRIPAGATTTLTVAGAGGLPPAGTFAAVVLNLTATNTSGSGFVEAYPDGASMPDVSDLNYPANQTIANAVIVQVGQDGKIDLANEGGLAGPIDLLADVSGYFMTGAGGAYVPLTPTRILDTRTDAPIAAGATADVDARAVIAALPADSSPGEQAFVVNTTVTGPTGTGFVTDYPHGSALPNVSTINYTPGLTAANLAFVGSGDGGIAVHNGGSQAGTTQAIVDLFGYFG